MNRNMVREKGKILLAFILGFMIAGVGVSASILLPSKEVLYDNSQSGGSSNNVQGAIEELYERTESGSNSCDCTGESSYFIAGYTYNQDSNSANYCVTGQEATCVETNCYKNKAKNSCKAGDIIQYKVNNTDIITFNVMYDNGNTLTMQSRENTLDDVVWISYADYVEAGGSNFGSNGNNNKGPITALKKLEDATRSWINVDNQDYTMGQTVFKKNFYTGCSDYNICAQNTYILGSRVAKSRMITVQEAVDLGCSSNSSSCPKWITPTSTYWTMNASSNNSQYAWYVGTYGHVYINHPISLSLGIRAVVVVSK